MVTAADGNGIAEKGLADFLSARARNARSSRITIDVAVGVVAVVVAIGLRPAWWPVLAAAGATLASFGCWAIVGRELATPSTSARAHFALELSHKVLAVIGVASAIATGFCVWAALMGTWIS